MKLRNTAELAAFFLLPALVLFGCSAADKPNVATSGLIATPASYYSTAKGRLLGERYKRNLETIVEKVVRNPKTVALQFANNIASVGGIGFFTHSAAALPDERYLEVVLAAPELFETASDVGSKLHRLFSQYGDDLLGILAGDSEIFEDRDVGGYGLNLSWRTLSQVPGAPKVLVERAVAYFSKPQARAFLRREMKQAELLKNAIVFAGAEDGSMALVSVQAQEGVVDFRPAILEENLVSGVKAEPKIEPAKTLPPAPVAVTPPPPKAPTMPTPETARRGSKPSEPMIVVMKPEPVEKIEAPLVPVPPPAAVPAPNMPTADRSPGSATVTAPLIVMVPPPAPVKAETAGLAADTAVKTAPAGAANRAEERAASVAPSAAQPQVETKSGAAPTPKSETAPSPSRSEPGAASKQDLAPPTPKAAPRREPEPVAVRSARESAPADNNVQVAKAEPVAAPSPAPSLPAVASTSSNQLEKKESQVQAAVQRELPVTPEVALKLPQSTVRQNEPARSPAPVVAPEPVAPSRATKVLPNPKVDEPVKEPSKQLAAPQSPVQSAAASASPAPEQLALSTPRIVETPPVEPRVSPAAPTSEPTTTAAPAPERMASLPKSEITTLDTRSLARPTPKALSGYIVQIAFNDTTAAQRWAERMERKGFAVSVTETGEAGAVRVRFGNFTVRADAERQLTALRQEGLRGIVLNLPQAFQPEMPSAVQ